MFRKLIPIFAMVSMVAAVCGADGPQIAAAISLKDALVKVAAQYKSDTGREVGFTYGSSGQLATQIQNGAPADLFVSAANKQVDDLIKAGSATADSQKVVAGNSLVLIVPADSKLAADLLKALTDAAVRKVALGEPKTVPAGQYAMQALEAARVAGEIKAKLIYGTNVRQVLDYVKRGEVSAAFVYATDAKTAGDSVRIIMTIDAATHDAIVYPAILIKGAKQQAQAAQFLEYLLSEKAQAILRDMGFAPPPAKAQTPAKP